MPKTRRPPRDELQRRFEDAATLQGLLEIAGSSVEVAQVAEQMKAAQARGDSPSSMFPSLFEAEPHFPSADIARRLYENLFGLWDLVADGKNWNVEKRTRPKKPPPPERPAPFSPDPPSAEFVEAAWRYLEAVDDRERNRLLDAFENRQDALLQWLDDQALSDEGYGQARHLLFELFAMIELGWAKGVSSADPSRRLAPGEPLPQALLDYSNEALFEAEQDEQAPLRGDERKRVGEAVVAGLTALWIARK